MALSILEKTPMTIKEASEYSKYSIPYLYKLIYDGKIPSYKTDSARQGKVLLCKEELAEFIFGKRRKTADEIRNEAEEILNKRGA